MDDDLGRKQWHAVVEDEMEMENVGVFNAAFCSLTVTKKTAAEFLIYR